MTLRVLVVDDDVLNLRIAARLLRELGHSGALAADGEKALQLLRRQSFDLMLLDINMPKLSGEDTLRALRAEGQRLAVLMVSGHDGEETRRHFLDLGANGFLAKPLAQSALQAALAQLGGN
ncbi:MULTISPECIES: response regulator [unclassified Brenneria]|uniref:response regulator n=1 Tax=unclassified Brenneria TaxID=2634434 RepID=UPI0029C2EA28|nr:MULTISPECIES: response regulator [unclassified Brenneria]MDX5631020.1 response regulator [Brenneria sp. L3-3Z]MDX5698101.1 response regulator [Brenneria sp. L4-2C]MEE3663621.1 response regulator [Brenneria sp. g21c3]